MPDWLIQMLQDVYPRRPCGWRPSCQALFLRFVSEDPKLPAVAESADPSEQSRERLDDLRARMQKLLAKQLRNFTMLFARVLAEEAPDPVHDLRVCTRRLQEILAALVPEKGSHKARSVRRTLRRVRRALGPWRNCDVALQWISRKERRISKPALKNGWKLARESIAIERERAIQSARRKLYKSGGIMLNQRIQQLTALSIQRLGGDDPAGVVRRAVAGAAGQAQQALQRAQFDRSVLNIHALRIETKRLRYRIELARELGAVETAGLIRWFKLLQDRLGTWHDFQELSRFITRALAADEVLMMHPRLAIELLREVEKIHAASSREVEELLHTASESEGSRQLDTWLQSYTSAGVNDSSSLDTAMPAPARPILVAVPSRNSSLERSSDQEQTAWGQLDEPKVEGEAEK